MEEPNERSDVLAGGAAHPSTPRRSSGHRSSGHWFVLGSAVLCAAALVLLRWFVAPDPRGYGTHEQLGLPPCAMVEVTGLPCPGCGVTTSVSLAVRGRWRDSLLNQPFGFLVALASPVFVLWAVWGHVSGRDLHQMIQRIRLGSWAIPLGAVLVASWIYKILSM